MYHEVLTWSQATLCSKPVRASQWKLWLLLRWGTLERHHGYIIWGYITAAATAAASVRNEVVLWLPCQPGENTCLQFLQLLESPSSLLAHTLPIVGSASSVDSVNRISHTCAQLFSHVWFFVTPQTVACQAPLSMGFPRQEDWSGLPLSSPDLPYVCVY